MESRYPQLYFQISDDIVFVRGTVPIIFDGAELDRYIIEIELSKNHPKGIPIVRETAGRIPQTADNHMNPADGTACVLLPDERWRVWPDGSTLLDFLDGPVRNYLIGRSLVELGDPWPFGQWDHGAEGIRQYYAELLGTRDVRAIVRFLEYLTKKKIKGHWSCYCQSGKHLRDCHMKAVQDLRGKIPRQVAMESLAKVLKST